MSKLRDFVERLASGEVFTSRDVLHVGKRSALDSAVHRLIKRGIIERRVRGVFMKCGSHMPELPIEEIALIKARSFDRAIVQHAEKHAARFGLIAQTRQEKFTTDGATTSFICDNQRVHMIKGSGRKMKLGDTQSGQALRAMWHLGRNRLTDEAIQTIIDAQSLDLRAAMERLIRLIPMWLVTRLRTHAALVRC